MLRSFIARSVSRSAAALRPSVSAPAAGASLCCRVAPLPSSGSPHRGIVLPARPSSTLNQRSITTSADRDCELGQTQRGFARSTSTARHHHAFKSHRPASARTPVHQTSFAGLRLPSALARAQAQPSQHQAGAGLREFFIAPIASQPLRWSDRLRFLGSETGVLGVSLATGYVATKAASESLAALVPDLDALVLVFGSSGLWMPVSIVSYLGLLRLLRKQGVAFTEPPPPCTRRGLRRLFKSTLAGKMGSESLIAWIVGAIAVATSLSVALRLTLMPRMAPMDEASLDDQWTPTFVIGLLGPVSEEVLFRALLFARCARFIGVAPAALFSGLAFGLMHGSDAFSAAQKGMLYGILYSVTGSLLVPIAMHVCWNSALELGGHRLSPMAPLDSVAEAFATKFGGLKEMGLSTEAHEGEMVAALQTWLLPATAPAPQPADPALTRSIFSALDYADKGYLDASEVAWLMTLQATELQHFKAVMHVVQRRIRAGAGEELDAIQRNMERMPADIALLEMPSVPAAVAAAAGEQKMIQPVQDSQSQSTTAMLKDSVALSAAAAPSMDAQRRGSHMHAEDDARVVALRTELLHRYYSIQWNAFYRAQFADQAAPGAQDGRCTLEAFESFFAKSFSTPKERAAILEALKASTDSVHPLAAMMTQMESTQRPVASKQLQAAR